LKTTSKDLQKTTKNNDCKTLGLQSVKIVRYNSIEELEKDNGIDIMDSDDNLIHIGDVAIIENVKNKNSPSIFKRTDINGTEMWIKENKNYLKDIINEEKKQKEELILSKSDYDEHTNLCHSIYSDYFDFDLENPNCSFNMDNDLFHCNSMDLTITQTIIKEKEEYIASLEDELKHFKKLDTTKKTIEKEIKNNRKLILDKTSNNSRIKKYEIEKRKEEDEIINKNIKLKKHCIHFEMINYISNIKNTTIEEKYKLYQVVFNNYLNTNYIYNLEEVNDDDENNEDLLIGKEVNVLKNNHNHTTCNICNQNLLCKHWYYGIKQIETDGSLDMNKIINIYGVESNGVFVCKICGELLSSTDVKDLVSMERGDQGKILAKREVLKDDEKEIEQNKKLNLIENNLRELEIQEKYDTDLYFRMEFYLHMKQLLNVNMTNNDEKEMILFIKTHEFIKKEALYSQLRIKLGNQKPMKFIHTLGLYKFNKYI